MTYTVGLIGEGITESLSPAMHMREAAALGVDYEYRILDLTLRPEVAGDLGAYLRRLREEGYAAVNVTHPFKQRIIGHLDSLTPAATTIDAVNLVLIGESFTGCNADWTGFAWAVETGLGDASMERVVQVGAGGAGSATAYALLQRGVRELVIADRVIGRARTLVERYAPLFPTQVVTAVELPRLAAELGRADGVVHATPIGMVAHPGVAFDVEAMRQDAWLAEIVYRPIETALVSGARTRGHRVLDGGLMAVGQAVECFRLITGREPDTARMREHMRELTREPA